MEALLSIDDMKTKTREFLIEDGKLGASDIIREFVQTRPLRVRLTKDELLDVANNLEEALSTIDSLNSELESIKARYKAHLKEAEGKVENLRHSLKDKHDIRKVDCIEIQNNTRGSIAEVRMDTMVIITERPMTADERQSKLWDEDEIVAESKWHCTDCGSVFVEPKELKNGEPQCPECHSLDVEQSEPEPVAIS